VDIGYDLADGDGDSCTVTVVVSDDGGNTWDGPVASLTGDVGAGVTSGAGRAIVWSSEADLPSAYGMDYKVRVYADDGQWTPTAMALIPAGEFEMGDHHDGGAEALPVHAVYVDSFYMDVYEVTNQQYAATLNWAWGQGGLITVTGGAVHSADGGTRYCDTATSSFHSRVTWNGSTFGVIGEELPPNDPGNKTNFPMTRVSWYGAAAYANWRSGMEGRTPSYNTSTWECSFAPDGYRLPTEAEWEYAARGGEHTPYYRYPWGDTIDGSNANYRFSGDPYGGGDPPWTTPVGYYDGNQTPSGADMANGHGLYDVAGNAWEWCNDRYGPYSHCDPAPCDNPRGPATGTGRVIRGGSWRSYEPYLRCAARIDFGPDDLHHGILGFRLAVDSGAGAGWGESESFTIDNRYCDFDDDCDDGTECTDDDCNAGMCENTPTNEGLPCDDGQFCNGVETCQSGVCTDQADPCLGLVCAEVSDICLSPVDLPIDPTHHLRKHRYLSIDPSTNDPANVAIKVEVAEMRRCQNAPTRACLTDADCDDVCDDSAGDPPHHTLLCPPNDCSLTDPPSTCVSSGPCVDAAPGFSPPLAWLVQQPVQQADGERTATLSNTVYSQDWSASSLLHIGGCGVVPCVTYHVYACDPADLDRCSQPLEVATQRFPELARPVGFPLYGDVCGGTEGDPPEVLPPDQYVNVKDLMVTQLTVINSGSATLPQAHPTWVDLHGPGTGIPSQYILNVSDLQAVYVYALTKTLPWVNSQGGSDPQDCP
jgi:formylglycine-generating enzyme required for sulfatase activity